MWDLWVATRARRYLMYLYSVSRLAPRVWEELRRLLAWHSPAAAQSTTGAQRAASCESPKVLGGLAGAVKCRGVNESREWRASSVASSF